MKKQEGMRSYRIYTSDFYKDGLFVYLNRCACGPSGYPSVDGWFFDLVNFELVRDVMNPKLWTGKTASEKVVTLAYAILNISEDIGEIDEL